MDCVTSAVPLKRDSVADAACSRH